LIERHLAEEATQNGIPGEEEPKEPVNEIVQVTETKKERPKECC
jgi:hypothetical protein